MDEQQSTGKLVPALIGGGIMAVLSTVPFISLGNCLCCLWILTGGAAAAYFYNANLPAGRTITGADGAVTGLLAGIFGALFGSILGYLFMSVGDSDFLNNILENAVKSRGDLGPEVDELMSSLRDRGNLSPAYMLIGLFFSLVLNTVFGTLGGLIGASLFKKKTQGEGPGTELPR